jgi:hypothetical protein
MMAHLAYNETGHDHILNVISKSKTTIGNRAGNRETDVHVKTARQMRTIKLLSDCMLCDLEIPTYIRMTTKMTSLDCIDVIDVIDATNKTNATTILIRLKNGRWRHDLVYYHSASSIPN